MEHEEEGSVGEVFLDVEDEAVHRVFEELWLGVERASGRGREGEGWGGEGQVRLGPHSSRVRDRTPNSPSK